MVSTRFSTLDFERVEWRLGRAITLFSRDRFTLGETDAKTRTILTIDVLGGRLPCVLSADDGVDMINGP